MNSIEKIYGAILCGLLAMLFAPIIVLFLSTGAVIVGYTKMSMSVAFIWGYVCGYTNQFHGHIDHERTQANIDLANQRLERRKYLRELR